VFGVRHTTNVIAASQQAASIVLKARESEVFARAEVTSLTTKRITTDGAVAVYRLALGVPVGETPAPRVAGSLDALVTLFARGTGNEGKTAWDAFNATTEFVDHQRMIRVGAGRDRAETRFENAVLGTGDDLKASVYDLLLAV